MYMYNKQVVYSDKLNKVVKIIFFNDSVEMLFRIGDWFLRGVISMLVNDIFLCFSKEDQFKVV